LVCLPFTLSFLALPTFAERAGRRVVSVWRPTVAWILWTFVGAGIQALLYIDDGFIFSHKEFGPRALLGYLIVMGYATAVVTGERVKVGAYCSLVICLTIHYYFGIAFIVLGCAVVAFAPRRGEREKIRSAVFTTKASAAADRGRLPRWACCVYFFATVTFIVLAGYGVFSTIDDRCSPCNCKDDTLIDCYADAKTLVLTDSWWNGIKSYLPWKLKLKNKDIKAIKPGAFEGMSILEKLVLGKNRISIIEPYTFAGLRKLWYLDLDGNKIQVVNSNAFRGLHSLEILRLRNNQINRIENGAFAGLDSLRTVDLRGNPVTCLDAHAAGLPDSVECEGFS